MKTAMIGWRGMVGSVLMQRMAQEDDFTLIEADFFSTSEAGGAAPKGAGTLLDAHDLGRLSEYDVILTCQGGDYTASTYEPLRATGWDGYWIDAASTLRMRDDCMIVLDPVNGEAIDQALASGIKTFAGGNCTVSLLLLAILPLLERQWVERVTSMTYQSVSGAGAAAVKELVGQIKLQAQSLNGAGSEATAMELAEIADRAAGVPGLAGVLGAPIASNLLPWIDAGLDDGRTREEWKGEVESNKILGGVSGGTRQIAVDGLCVRVPVFRCHSQALALQLREAVSLEELERALETGHEWLDYVPNVQAATIDRLAPSAVSGTLKIAVGRLRQLSGTSDTVTLFTVGDQLLWGAAEPLRRMLRKVVGR